MSADIGQFSEVDDILLEQWRSIHDTLVVQSRNVDLGNPIQLLPPLAQRIACRLEELLGVAFDQLTVNEYEPGVGLSAHVDTHSAFTGKSVCAPELSTPLQQRTALDRPHLESGDPFWQQHNTVSP